MYRGETETCRALLDSGADINGKWLSSTPLLATAFGNASLKTLKLLVSNPNLKLDAKVLLIQVLTIIVIVHVFDSMLH